MYVLWSPRVEFWYIFDATIMHGVRILAGTSSMKLDLEHDQLIMILQTQRVGAGWDSR